jgi:hypothetical protein
MNWLHSTFEGGTCVCDRYCILLHINIVVSGNLLLASWWLSAYVHLLCIVQLGSPGWILMKFGI